MKVIKIKYPKFFLLILTLILAYVIFKERNFLPLHDSLLSLGYLGTFFSGLLFTYGFTAAPATALLLILAKEQNILFAGLIAGFGAVIGDLTIFKLIRYSFSDEIKKISKEKIVLYFNKKTPTILKKYLIPVLGGFIIASPLPDEIGISLLAISRIISTRKFLFISYLLNTIGILVILIIGNTIL